MWHFFYVPLQGLTTAVVIAVFWWLTRAITRFYEKDSARAFRIGYVINMIVFDALTGYEIVSRGVAVGTRTHNLESAVPWAELFYYMVLRLWMTHSVSVRKRLNWVSSVLEKRIEGEYLETIAARWSVEILSYFNKPYLDLYLAYLIVSTFGWLWVALYFALIRWRP